MEKSWTEFFLNALPFLLLVAFWFFMMRKMKWAGASNWQKNLERQLELQEIQTLKETNELLKKLIANR